MTSSPAEDLEPPIRQMFDATNREDREAFLLAFAEDAVLDDWGRTFEGRERISAWNANENMGVHSRIEVTSVRREGGSVLVGVEVRGDGYNGGGTFEFDVAGEQITRMRITG